MPSLPPISLPISRMPLRSTRVSTISLYFPFPPLFLGMSPLTIYISKRMVDISSSLYCSNALKLDNETYVGLINVITRFQGRISQLQGGTLLLMPQPLSLSMV